MLLARAVGKDGEGKGIMQFLEQEVIPTRLIRCADNAVRGRTFILVDGRDQYVIVHAGASKLLKCPNLSGEGVMKQDVVVQCEI